MEWKQEVNQSRQQKMEQGQLELEQFQVKYFQPVVNAGSGSKASDGVYLLPYIPSAREERFNSELSRRVLLQQAGLEVEAGALEREYSGLSAPEGRYDARKWTITPLY